ncbi:hypothetical protein C5167_036073 [Papaver somniferum]|nr:hypothetical protein C5167_036073 [Papaver somniferum]
MRFNGLANESNTPILIIFHTVPIFVSYCQSILTAILENRSFHSELSSSTSNPEWTVGNVCEVLRSIPRYFFQSCESIGRQKGFRHRTPLKQRNLKEESEHIEKGIHVLGPGAYIDPMKVKLGLDKALEFYYWDETLWVYSY